jgi:axial budding pattern protein 2
VKELISASRGASSISAISGEGESTGDMGPPTKPRLVPFTPSNRVPVPQVPKAIGIDLPLTDGAANTGFVGNRITSQRAKVCKVDSKDVIVEEGSMIKPSGTSDELSMGMHYVRSLGADQLTVHSAAQSATTGGSSAARLQGPAGPRSPALSNVRSSFTSLESSHLGNKSGTDADVTKVVVRAGERFKFRLSVPSGSPDARKETKGYSVKMTSGQPLPKFMQADLSEINTRGVLELSGVPALRDMGEVTVGVYTEKEGICIARAIVEVVGKR